MAKLIDTTAGELSAGDRFYIGDSIKNCKPYVMLGFNLFNEPTYGRVGETAKTLPADRKVKRHARLIEILYE